jgi:hypothetical protein
MKPNEIKIAEATTFVEAMQILDKTEGVLNYQELAYGDELSGVDYKNIAEAQVDLSRVRALLGYLITHVSIYELRERFPDQLSDAEILDIAENIPGVKIIRCENIIEEMQLEELHDKWLDTL